jgi:hypothetical protein
MKNLSVKNGREGRHITVPAKHAEAVLPKNQGSVVYSFPF